MPEAFEHAEPAAVARGLGRGINFGNMFEPPLEGAWNVYYEPDYVGLVKCAGFSHVRLPVRWSNHAAVTEDATLDEDFAQRIDQVIDLALANDLYVVLDAHHYRQLEGAPLDAGEAEVEGDVVESRLVNIWAQLAERYSGRSNRLVYELYNEPHGALTPATWNPLAARLLEAVRAHDPERAVVLGATEWYEAKRLAELEVPDDPNLILTFHDYEPYEFTLQGTGTPGSVAWIGTTCCDESQQATLLAAFDAAKSFADAQGRPMYLGEFGSSKLADHESRVHHARFMRTQAEARNMPWAVWSLIDFGIYEVDSKTFIADLKQALVGP